MAYGISAVFCKLFSVPVSSERDAVTEEENKNDGGRRNETGVLEESQREMINNIFEFGDADISDVMTHRKDICAIEVNSKMGISFIWQLMRGTLEFRFTRKLLTILSV